MRIPYTLILISLVLILFGCNQQSSNPEMKKEHNRSGKEITITVFEYPTHNDVTRALATFQRENKQTRTDAISLGWSAWDREEPYQCQIHIVPPERIDDDLTLTLGHEMSHCLYGTYHQ